MISVYTKPTFSNEYFNAMEATMALLEDELNMKSIVETLEEFEVLGYAIADKELRVVREEVSLGELANKKITERKTKGAWESIKYFFQRIIDFLTESASKFIEAAGRMLQSYEEWFKINRAKIDPSAMTEELRKNISFTVIPYFESGNCEKRLQSPDGIPNCSTVTQIADEIENENNAKKLERMIENEEEFYRTHFATLYSIDPKNSKKAALMYWRGFDKDNLNFSTKRYSGTDSGANSAQALTKMIQYCNNYKVFVNQAKNMIEKTTKELKDWERKNEQRERQFNRMVDRNEDQDYKQNLYNRKSDAARQKIEQDILNKTNTKNTPVKNSAFFFNENLDSVLEGCSLYDLTTEERGFDIVIEAGAAVANKTQEPTKVQKTAANQNFNEQKNKRAIKANKSGFIVKCCKMHNTIATARMTVSEEIFRHYVKVFQDISDAIDEYEGKAKKNQENIQYNTDQRQKELEAHEERKENARMRREERLAGQGFLRRAWNRAFGK